MTAGVSNRAPGQAIEAVRALSRAMREAAAAADWEALAAREAERRSLLAELFALPLSGEGPLADLAREVLAGDRQILALAERSRQELEQSLAALEQGRRAVRAYRRCMGEPPP